MFSKATFYIQYESLRFIKYSLILTEGQRFDIITLKYSDFGIQNKIEEKKKYIEKQNKIT